MWSLLCVFAMYCIYQLADFFAKAQFNKLYNHSHSPTRVYGRGGKCAENFKKVQCALAFPACEIGRETKYLCTNICTDLAARCGVDDAFCQNRNFTHKQATFVAGHEVREISRKQTKVAFFLMLCFVSTGENCREALLRPEV